MYNQIAGFLTLAFVACATTKETTVPTKAATPRDDCPPGYAHVTDERGTACWKAGEKAPPIGCKPFRCPASGHMLWDCSEEEAKACDEPSCTSDIKPERRLTAEEFAELLLYKNECRRYRGLSHHGAELTAMELWRNNTEKAARYSECLTAFALFERLTQEVPPRQLGFADASVTCPALPENPSETEVAASMMTCLREQVQVLGQMSKSMDQTSRWLGVVMEHDRCVAEFEINERFFDWLFCYEVERVLTRYGN